MKLTTEDKNAVNGVTTDSNIVKFPQGIFGFPDLRSCELIFNQEELPFMWLQEQQKGGLAFIVLEPIGFIPDYTVEISDGDVAFLGIQSPEDVLILNIVTINKDRPEQITANLVGPLIVNRQTRVGKQVIVNNYERYSAKYELPTGKTEEQESIETE
jgi:flagellar assembly factor FliW